MNKFELLSYLLEEQQKSGRVKLAPSKEEDIQKVETWLGFRMPPLYRKFLLLYGNSDGGVFDDICGTRDLIGFNKALSERLEQYGKQYNYPPIGRNVLVIGGEGTMHALSLIDTSEKTEEHTLGFIDFEQVYDFGDERKVLWGGGILKNWGECVPPQFFKSTWLEYYLDYLLRSLGIRNEYHPLNFVNWEEFKKVNKW
jgi:hypothetical protein